jgi:hypothetical protein
MIYKNSTHFIFITSILFLATFIKKNKKLHAYLIYYKKGKLSSPLLKFTKMTLTSSLILKHKITSLKFYQIDKGLSSLLTPLT